MAQVAVLSAHTIQWPTVKDLTVGARAVLWNKFILPNVWLTFDKLTQPISEKSRRQKFRNLAELIKSGLLERRVGRVRTLYRIPLKKGYPIIRCTAAPAAIRAGSKEELVHYISANDPKLPRTASMVASLFEVGRRQACRILRALVAADKSAMDEHWTFQGKSKSGRKFFRKAFRLRFPNKGIFPSFSDLKKDGLCRKRLESLRKSVYQKVKRVTDILKQAQGYATKQVQKVTEPAFKTSKRVKLLYLKTFKDAQPDMSTWTSRQLAELVAGRVLEYRYRAEGEIRKVDTGALDLLGEYIEAMEMTPTQVLDLSGKIAAKPYPLWWWLKPENIDKLDNLSRQGDAVNVEQVVFGGTTSSKSESKNDVNSDLEMLRKMAPDMTEAELLEMLK